MSSGSQVTIYSTSEILDACLNLVVVDQPASFRFAHLSVREFLEGLSKRGIAFFQPADANANIASTCLSHLFSVYEPMSERSLSRRDASFEDVNRGVTKYMVEYWIHHVSQCENFKNNPPVESLVRTFLISDKEIAPTFSKWCKHLFATHTGYFGHRLKKLLRTSFNPIWIVQEFKLMETHQIPLSDETVQRHILQLAVERENPQVIFWLVEQRANIKKICGKAAFTAIKKGCTDILRLLLKHEAPIHQDYLFLAVMLELKDTVTVLLEERGSCFDAGSLSKALTTAVSNGDSDTVTMLLHHGATKEVVAVARAIRVGIQGAACNLINLGFDLTTPCFIEQRTPLHWAAERGFDNIVKKLLVKGVSLDVKDRDGNTPLDLAVRKKRSSVIMVFQNHGVGNCNITPGVHWN
jgi:ankyrin repeat protein